MMHDVECSPGCVSVSDKLVEQMSPLRVSMLPSLSMLCSIILESVNARFHWVGNVN